MLAALSQWTIYVLISKRGFIAYDLALCHFQVQRNNSACPFMAMTCRSTSQRKTWEVPTAVTAAIARLGRLEPAQADVIDNLTDHTIKQD